MTISPTRATDYPMARRDDLVEDHHGTAVADPYRWLEDPDDPQTQQWVAAQHRLSREYLDRSPWKRIIRERLRAVWSLRTCHTALVQGGRYFFFHNDGEQEQDTLQVMDSPDAESRVLLDPAEFCGPDNGHDGAVATISYATASPDGRLLAYSMSYGGSDWQEWRIREVSTGRDLPDQLLWSKFSSAGWNADGTGFYYTRYDAPPPEAHDWDPDRDPRVVFHRVGTSQDDDELIYQDPDNPEQGITVGTTEDGAYLLLFIWRGTDTTNLLRVKDLRTPGAAIAELLPSAAAAYSYIAGHGDTLWLQTDLDAPRGRIITVDPRRPDEFTQLVAEADDAIQGAGVISAKLYVAYLTDAACRVQIFHRDDGQPLGELPLPERGTLEGLRSAPTGTEAFFSFTSFTRPATVYRLDASDDSVTVFFAPTYTFDPDSFLAEQIWYDSADGTRVPMWVCRHRDVPLDGSAPTFLAAYGGFGFAITPTFTPGPIAWMQLGGVYALANVRGGGEFGEEWHRAGSGRNKIKAVEDLIAAAEWLSSHGYTSPQRLGLGGISNGGTLVAAAAVRRPDVCGCVIPVNGVLDLLRFHQFTIGWSWVFEYGSAEDPEDFAALYELSPLHRLRSHQTYPATLICTATRDDRVVPAHSYKFAATLQHTQSGTAPVLLRVDLTSGHARDARATEGLEDLSDRWTFAAHTLGMRVPPEA
ncbi:prolyl oligopeptidase family serine peptidase [Micromonospora craniellae]|uniref:prolyl oligopeptidase n=1 Tax=Micromonospora craniellae TaxID=2294034 RepID=A0A372FZG9_9ACTN|nr:prolyl oligopeptidase family serine peptidase [Micromonospora craniellae]QOC93443.1 S9 family peptidase [Micromonospora craniellae]RFS45890.1 S9 family peptidase [Micromonospora craniellae]